MVECGVMRMVRGWIGIGIGEVGGIGYWGKEYVLEIEEGESEVRGIGRVKMGYKNVLG